MRVERHGELEQRGAPRSDDRDDTTVSAGAVDGHRDHDGPDVDGSSAAAHHHGSDDDTRDDDTRYDDTRDDDTIDHDTIDHGPGSDMW